MNPLLSKDVCAILKACHQNRVVKLAWAGLTVEFAAGEPGETQASVYDPFEKRVKATGKKAEEAVEAAAHHGLVQSEVTLRDDELDQLNVEDPVAYQKFLLSEDVDSLREDEVVAE